jgi:two-component sensor histidine kinase
MKRAGKVFLLLLLLVLNVTLFRQLKREYEIWRRGNTGYIAKPLYGSPLDGLIRFGSDKNGADLLIGTYPEFRNSPGFKQIILFSPFRKTFMQVGFYLHLKVPQNRYYFPPADVDGDGKVEIPLFWISDRQVYFELRDFLGKIISTKKLEPLSLPIPSDKISFGPIAIDDIDADGRLEAIWSMSGEFLGLPRGIAVHDIATGKKKWDFLFGATFSGAKIVDLDGDGKKEIVFSAWAPHNGYAYNGMNDDTSYIGALNCRGRLLWLNQGGGFFSEMFFDVADIDGDGKPEIVTTRACHRQIDPDPGEIKILRADNGAVSEAISKPRVSFSRPFIHQTGGSSGSEIVVGDSSGRLSILDAKLRMRKQVAVGEPVKVLGLYPGKTEEPLIAATIGPNGSRLYDLSLNMVHDNPLKADASAGLSMLPVTQGKTHHLLLVSDQLYLVSRNPNSHSSAAALFTSSFSLTLAWMLAFNALFFLWRREHSKKQAPGAKGGREDSGWLTVTQEMVHRMKTPMTNILWEAEQLKTGLENMKDPGALPEGVKKTPDSLIGELKELKLMNRYLMKFLQIQSPKFKTTDLNSLLCEVVEKYSRHLKERIRFNLNLDKTIPRLALDEEQITEVFVNIIENAIDAMPAGGELEIASNWRTKETKGVSIVFKDNGKGIPEEQIKLIFTSNYTTKKEGFGIGLPVCQRIVAAHGGRIEIQSRVGIGTRIALFFPWERSAIRKNE